MEENIKYINVLNIFSCISVIALHCNGCFWKFSYASYWRSAVFIETLFYTAVPCFFMIIGVTSIDYIKKYDTSIFFIRRVKKTVLPFLFWSLVSIIFQGILHNVCIDPNYALNIINSIMNVQTMPIYWFFIPLFAVYLSIPLISAVPTTIRKEKFTYVSLVALVTGSILPMFFKVLDLQYNYELSLPVAGGYIIYILIGYLLEYCYNLHSKQRIIIYFMGFLGWAMRMISTYKLSLEEGKINNIMGGYCNFPTVFFAIAVFVFFKYDLQKMKWYQKISTDLLRKLSSCSFGIYLVHMYFVQFYPRIFGFAEMSIYWRTFGVIWVYISCLMFVYTIKKIPYIKFVLP